MCVCVCVSFLHKLSLQVQLSALRKYIAVLEAENAALKGGLPEDQKASCHSEVLAGEAETEASGDTERINSRFVDLEMETERLRTQVEDLTSTEIVLKATIAALLSQIAELESRQNASKSTIEQVKPILIRACLCFFK